MDACTSSTLWLKYFFRFLHIAPVVVLGGKIFNDYVLGNPKAELTKEQSLFYMLCGIVLIVAGFVNTFLLKPKDNMKQQAKFWIGFHHLKLLLAVIILTPLLGMVASPATVNHVRFAFVLVSLLVSPFMRFYREYHTEKHRKSANEFVEEEERVEAENSSL